MKILWIEHNQMDLGAFNQYMGLCEILGPENVIVFPHKKLYHGEIDHCDDGYTQFLREYVQRCRDDSKDGSGADVLPWGIPPMQPGEDITSGWPVVRELPYILLQPKQKVYTEDEIVNEIKAGTFSFTVLTTGHRISTITLARLRDRVGGLGGLPPIVYVDNGERDEMNEHWAHVFRPKVIFKLILTPEVYNFIKNKYGWELHCLPQSNALVGKDIRATIEKYSEEIPDQKLPGDVTFDDDMKTMDVYYTFGNTYEKRNELRAIVSKYLEEQRRKGTDKQEPYGKYLANFAHARIGISMRGSGRDTTRYWDIPLFKTLMVCDGTMGCMHPHPFEDRKTAIFYDENHLEQLPDILEFYLRNDSIRMRIAEAGCEHLRKYHTNRARAEYFLDIVKKELRLN